MHLFIPINYKNIKYPSQLIKLDARLDIPLITIYFNTHSLNLNTPLIIQTTILKHFTPQTIARYFQNHLVYKIFAIISLNSCPVTTLVKISAIMSDDLHQIITTSPDLICCLIKKYLTCKCLVLLIPV